jgi:uncharacterized protein
MKVLALADRPASINIKDVVMAEGIELIVTLGDLTREDLIMLEYVTDIPKIGVYGNHCSGNYMEDLGIMNMHQKIWEYGGLKFGGFEGCVRYKESRYAPMYTQDEANEMMDEFPYVDVFLSHCPPRGVNDLEEIAHQGFDALRSYLDTHSPKYWMHGHTYPTEDSLITKYRDTKVEYVFGYKIIDLFAGGDSD